MLATGTFLLVVSVGLPADYFTPRNSAHGTKLPFIGVVHVNDGQPDLFEWLNNHSDEQIKNIRGYCDNPGSHLGIYEKRIQDIFVCRVGIEKSYDQRNNNDSQKEAA